MGGIAAFRAHPLWLAHAAHRLSGLALVLFLPAHFWLLARAISDPAGLDRALQLAEAPGVKLAETGLVFLLALHAFGGLRLLAQDVLPMSGAHRTLAAGAVALALLVAGLFLLQVV